MQGPYMPIQNLEEWHRRFSEAFNAGDLDAVMALYEPGASLVAQPGELATGAGAIRQALSAFRLMQPTLKVETQRIVQAGDIALLHGRWTLTGTGPDGNAINLAGQSSEVVRRQADGSWRCVIDNPYSGYTAVRGS